jgi:nucleoside-diphosphate-sugar epimerase
MRQRQYDAVIHTVCDYGRQGQSAFEITQTNLMLGLELLDAAANNGVNTFLNTDSLLSPDVNAYALSKHQFVDWLKFYSNRIQVINLRLEHMYGPKDDPTKFVSWLLTQFKTKVKRIPLTEGYQKRDFVFITDVVNAYKTTFNSSSELTEYTEFDVGSGSLTSVREFVTALKDAYREVDRDCITELGFGDTPMRSNEKSEIKVDLSALHGLNWENTTTLDEGLKTLVREYR